MRVQGCDLSENVDASTGHDEVVPVSRRLGEQSIVFGSGRGKGAVAVLQQRMRENFQGRRELRGVLRRKMVVAQGDVLEVGVVSVAPAVDGARRRERTIV